MRVSIRVSIRIKAVTGRIIQIYIIVRRVRESQEDKYIRQ